MCKTLALVCCLTICAPFLECQEESEESTFSADQLDNLLAPVALYPDPLLAQLLVAATFPDEIDEAARVLRADSDPASIDGEPWDVSVKAIAHYPQVLSMLADSLDWTTALGQAYAWQGDDVMATIQRLRAKARSVGNLQTGPQQDVVDDSGNIEIWPAEPDNIYVPSYDPDVVYFGSGGAMDNGVETFGPACLIGVWLNRDFNWRHRKIYYHGWNNGAAWVTRARPNVPLNPAYVNRRFQNVVTGRAIESLKVNRGALDRYTSVHRDLTFDRAAAVGAPAGNRVIERNIDTSDPRIDAFRGVEPQPAKPVPQPPAREVYEPERVAHMPESIPQPIAVEHFQPQEPQPSHNEAFGNRGPFEPQAASQRGAASRSEMTQPAPRHESPAPSRAPVGHDK